MRDAIQAALRIEFKRLLVFEPTVQLASFLAGRSETTFLTVVHGSLRAARRSQRQLRALEPSPPAFSVIHAEPDNLPLRAEAYDAVLLVRGFANGDRSPVELLHTLRDKVRSGGVVMVGSRLREGALGGVGSLVKRVGRQGALPKAADLTAWMLIAGMRKVRQTSLPRALVPTVLTWADVRRRPWEKEREIRKSTD